MPWTFASTIGTEIGLVGLSFLTGMLSARWLGPEGRGEFAVILLWPNVIAAVGNLGIRDALVYYQAKGEHQQSLLDTTALLLALVQSGILVGIGLLLVPYLTRSQSASVQRLSLQFLAFIPLNLLALYMLGLLRGQLNIYAYNAIRISVNVIYLGSMGALWLLNAVNLQNLTYALLAANLVTASWATGRAIWNGGLTRGMDFPFIRALFGYGVRNHLGSISNMLNQRLDQMLMAVVLSPSELGWYVVAVSSSGFVNLVSRTLAVFTFPKVAGAQGKSVSRQLVGVYSRINITGTLLMGAALMVVLPWAIPFIYTPAFKPSILPAEILVIATMFLAIGQNWAAAFQGDGQPIMLAKAEGISLLVTLAGLTILLPLFGITGAALASVLAYGTSMIYLFIHLLQNWEISQAAVLTPLMPSHLIDIIKIQIQTKQK